MRTVNAGSACLSTEVLHEAALERPLPADAAAHLEGCASCQANVTELRAALAAARVPLIETMEAALAAFRLPPLPERQPQRSSLWSLLAAPVPAYAAAAVLMLLLLPLVVLRAPGGQPRGEPAIEIGGEKGFTLGQSAEESFTRIYDVDPGDAARLQVSYQVIGTYAEAHPEDLAAHLKLVQVCQALLKLSGWESEELGRPEVEERLAAEQKTVRDGLAALTQGGERQ